MSKVYEYKGIEENNEKGSGVSRYRERYRG